VESSKGKILWDPNFDISKHGESDFLLDEDRTRLMAHDENLLLLDSKKLIGEAVALACVTGVKARDWKNDEVKRVQQNAKI